MSTLKSLLYTEMEDIHSYEVILFSGNTKIQHAARQGDISLRDGDEK
jgi:hypothetical protein